MRLQLHLGGCCASTRIRRQIVWTTFVIDVICGLLCRGWRWWWLLQMRYVRGRRDMLRGYGRGARKGGAIYDCTVVIHGGGTKSREGRGGRRRRIYEVDDDGDQFLCPKFPKHFSFRIMHQFYARGNSARTLPTTLFGKITLVLISRGQIIRNETNTEVYTPTSTSTLPDDSCNRSRDARYRAASASAASLRVSRLSADGSGPCCASRSCPCSSTPPPLPPSDCWMAKPPLSGC